MSDVLDMAGVADRLGLSRSTVRYYRRDGLLPPADGMVGQSPYWLPETIERWQAHRPGRGVGGGRPRKTP